MDNQEMSKYHLPFTPCQVLSTIGSKYAAHAGQQYRFCGSELPPPLTSDTNEMLVTLRTDGSVSHRGFRARWSTEELPREFERENSNFRNPICVVCSVVQTDVV